MKTENRKSICLFFHAHQPFRLKNYHFFNIGVDHAYFDDARNRHIMKLIAHNCYLPANDLLMTAIKHYGSQFKVTIGLSGTAIEQFTKYTPWVLESFRKLYQTGNVEFVAEPNSSSLAMLSHPDEYKRQVETHSKTIKNLFGCNPVTLMNTNLIYSNHVAHIAKELGFNTILTEGAGQVLEWRSPNYIYSCDPFPEVKLLLRNQQLSDDINFRFSDKKWCDWPLTAGKFISWLDALDTNEEIVNLILDYATLGEYQKTNSGIFSFFEAFINETITAGKWKFTTVSEAAERINPVSTLNVPETISWGEHEHNLTAWLGNELQLDAYQSLYSVIDVMESCTDQQLLGDWNKLQTADHFYYMNTNSLHDGIMQKLFSPYNSPFEAYVNYMNVISDFLIRTDQYSDQNDQLNLQKRLQYWEEEMQFRHYQLETV